MVAHLIDVDLRRLSAGRDCCQPDECGVGCSSAPLQPARADRAAARIGRAMAGIVSGLPPHAPAPYGVALADRPYGSCRARLCDIVRLRDGTAIASDDE